MKRLSFACALLAASILGHPKASHAQDFKIYGTESPPGSYLQDGKITGTTADIVEGLRKSLGISTEIEVLPSARATEYVEHNPNVLAFSYVKTPEREKAGFHFIGPVITRSQMLWKKKGSPISIGSLADVKSQNLTVGGVTADQRSKFIKDAGVTVSEVHSADLNMKKLVADRIPLMIASNFDMPLIAKLAGADMADVESVYTFNETSAYLMFSKDTDQATIDKWQNAYLALQKTDFFSKLAEKWSQTLSVPLKFAPDKGFYVP